jgi:hypothetical protein
MTAIEMAEWLEEMWTNSPDPHSGEESYRWLQSRVERIVRDEREALIGALQNWLSLRSVPETMTAADLAADFHLTELRPDLFKLLEDIEGGRTKFLPGLKFHYANRVADCLSRI